MKTIKHTDLSGGHTYINMSSLIRVAQNAMQSSRHNIQNTLAECETQIHGNAVMPGTIDVLKWQVEGLQLANEVLYALQQTTNARSSFDKPDAPIAKRQLHIVRDDITAPEGFALIKQYDKIKEKDLQWDDENCQWIDARSFGAYCGDKVIIRPIAK